MMKIEFFMYNLDLSKGLALHDYYSLTNAAYFCFRLVFTHNR